MAEAAEPNYQRLLETDRPRWPSDRLYEHYRRHYLSEVERGRFIIDTLRYYLPAFAPEQERVLDIGCGDAGVPIAFAAAGARAAGLEPGSQNLRRGLVRAADHGVAVALVEGVAEALPFPDGSRTLVILDNVLEHVRDREQTLKEIHRVLPPEGILYLVTPKPFSLFNLASDPHYSTPGLVLLPRRWQEAVIERRVGPGAYDVGTIPTRRWVNRALVRHGFESLVPPRDLWVRYVRAQVARPEQVRGRLKRRVAGWLTRHATLFGNPLLGWLLDVGLGSNFFIARRSS